MSYTSIFELLVLLTFYMFNMSRVGDFIPSDINNFHRQIFFNLKITNIYMSLSYLWLQDFRAYLFFVNCFHWRKRTETILILLRAWVAWLYCLRKTVYNIWFNSINMSQSFKENNSQRIDIAWGKYNILGQANHLVFLFYGK